MTKIQKKNEHSLNNKSILGLSGILTNFEKTEYRMSLESQGVMPGFHIGFDCFYIL